MQATHPVPIDHFISMCAGNTCGKYSELNEFVSGQDSATTDDINPN